MPVLPRYSPPDPITNWSSMSDADKNSALVRGVRNSQDTPINARRVLENESSILLDVPGVGRVDMWTYHVYGRRTGPETDDLTDFLSVYDALDPLNDQSPMVVRMSTGENRILYSRHDKRAVLETLAVFKARLLRRCAEYFVKMATWREQIRGTETIYDSAGIALTGSAALEARRRLYVDVWWPYQFARNVSYSLFTESDRTFEVAAAPSDAEGRREWASEKVAQAAENHSAWVLDAPDPRDHEGSGGTTEQEAALREISVRRQTGIRNIRRAGAAVAAIDAAMNSSIASINSVAVTGGPVWKAAGSSSVLTARHTVTYSATAFTVGMVAENPAGQKHGVVAIDPLTGLGDWTVTYRSGATDSTSHEAHFTRAAGKVPPPGDYDFDLVARNECGPTKAQLRITVPTPSPPSDSD